MVRRTTVTAGRLGCRSLSRTRVVSGTDPIADTDSDTEDEGDRASAAGDVVAVLAVKTWNSRAVEITVISAISGVGGARERACVNAAKTDDEDVDENDGMEGATDAADAAPRRRNLGFGFGSAADVEGLAFDSGNRLLPGKEGIVLNCAQSVQ